MTYEDCRKNMNMGPHDSRNPEDLLCQAFFLAGQAQGVKASLAELQSERLKRGNYAITLPTS